MGWDSRRYREGGADSRRRRSENGGGVRAVLRRIFGDGENPLDWALPLYTAWGIRVRLSLWYILWMASELTWSLAKDSLGWQYRAMAMGVLFVLVLLHEYGHCIACRRVGGSADQILMWPLGGLAYCAPPHNWRADLITVIGGPLVNVLLAPIFAGVLLALGQDRSVLVFNPFNPAFAIGSLAWHGAHPMWLIAIWWAYYLNLVLLAFNVLLPMYPMDGGRILHGLLWRSIGYRRALDITTKVGIAAAIALLIFAAVPQQGQLLMVAFMGLATCWLERRRLAMTSSDPALEGYDFESGYSSLPPEDEPEDTRAVKARERRQRQEQDEQAELDRILAKIAASGMGSLSRAERRWLERATERRRHG